MTARQAVRERWLAGYATVTTRPLALYGTAVLRIGYGLAYLAFLLREFPNRDALWGPSAAWTPALDHRFAQSADWYGWIRTWYTLLATTSDARFQLSYVAALLICAAMVAGLYTRFTSVLFMLVVTAFSGRNIFVTDGGDNVMILMSIYLVFTASGRRLSLDSRFAVRPTARAVGSPALLELAEVRRRVVTVCHNAAVLVIACQMCVIYGAAGLWKAQGSMWQDGTAMYYVLHLNWFRVWPGLSDFVAGNGTLIAIIAYATVFAQVGLVFVVFNRRLKYVFLGVLLGMHLGIALLLGLPLFSAMMLIGDSVFLPDAFWLAVGRVARRRLARFARRRDPDDEGRAEPATATA